MATQKTLIVVLDNENDDAHVFMVTHVIGFDAWPAIVKAFKEYVKTADGKKYIKYNGSNCSDALFMSLVRICPKQFLIKHGILSVKAVDGDHRVIINHNDCVLDYR